MGPARCSLGVSAVSRMIVIGAVADSIGFRSSFLGGEGHGWQGRAEGAAHPGQVGRMKYEVV